VMVVRRESIMVTVSSIAVGAPHNQLAIEIMDKGVNA
jgi:hypothetical protein